jgi:hypothetical protein
VETVYLSTNDPDEPEIKLQIGGHVEPEVAYTPQTLYFGDVRKGILVTKKIKILNKKKDGKIEISKIEVFSKYITTEKTRTNDDEYEILVKLTPDVSIGQLDTAIKVSTNSKNWPFFEIPISANVKGDIEVNPKEIFFGIVKVKNEGSLTRTIKIANAGNRFLKIQRIENNLNSISVKVVPKIEGKEYEMIVTLKPSFLAPGNINGKVKLYTNNPNQPVLEMPIYGLIAN